MKGESIMGVLNFIAEEILVFLIMFLHSYYKLCSYKKKRVFNIKIVIHTFVLNKNQHTEEVGAATLYCNLGTHDLVHIFTKKIESKPSFLIKIEFQAAQFGKLQINRSIFLELS